MKRTQRRSRGIAAFTLAFLLGVSALSSVAAEKPATPSSSSIQFSILYGKRAMQIAAANGTIRVLVSAPVEEKDSKKTKEINATVALYKISSDGSEKKIELEKVEKKALKDSNRAIYTVTVKNKDDLKTGAYEIRVADATATTGKSSKTANAKGANATKRVYLSPEK